MVGLAGRRAPVPARAPHPHLHGLSAPTPWRTSVYPRRYRRLRQGFGLGVAAARRYKRTDQGACVLHGGEHTKRRSIKPQLRPGYALP